MIQKIQNEKINIGKEKMQEHNRDGNRFKEKKK